MKNLSELYKRIGETSMSVLSARPGTMLIELLSNLVIEEGIKKKSTVTIYMNGNAKWMTTHILNALTHIPFRDLDLYLSPLDHFKNPIPKIDTAKMLASIETLIASDVVIEDLNFIEKDYTDSIVDFEEEIDEPSDMIIFYEVEHLFNNSPYSPREILEKLSRLTARGTKIVFIAKMERGAEKHSVQNFENIHNYGELKNFVELSLIIHKYTVIDEEKSKALVTTNEGEFEIIKDEKTGTLKG